MPVTEVIGTLTPTLTPEEQAALDAALAYVGDKVLNLQLAYIITGLLQTAETVLNLA